MGSLMSREGGATRSRRNLYDSIESMVERLKLEKLLEGHHGCVNAISWNADGSMLFSGSDDLQIILWNRMGMKIHSFSPGHTSNIFQSKPLDKDDSTVLSAAADGAVRVSTLTEGGGVTRRLLGRHRGRSHKLAIDPDNPKVFASCGEDGRIMLFDLRLQQAKTSSHLVMEEGLNAIAFNPTRPWMLAVVGDEASCRLFDARCMPAPDETTELVAPMATVAPDEIKNQRSRHITHCCFSSHGQLLLSYHRHDLFLFDPISQDGATVSAVRKKRARSEDHNLETREEGEEGDIVASESGSQANEQSSSSGFIFNRSFTGHRNSQTVKSCNFLGLGGRESQYVMSGSDCGRIFIWETSTGRLVQLLQGDRHVVNVLEPHPLEPLTFATSGIEDSIKLWGPRSEESTVPSEEEMKRVVEGSRRPGGGGGGGGLLLSPDEMVRMLIHRRNALQGLSDGDDYDDEEEEEGEEEEEEGEEESEMPSWAIVEGDTDDDENDDQEEGEGETDQDEEG